MPYEADVKKACQSFRENLDEMDPQPSKEFYKLWGNKGNLETAAEKFDKLGPDRLDEQGDISNAFLKERVKYIEALEKQADKEKKLEKTAKQLLKSHVQALKKALEKIGKAMFNPKT